MTLLSYTEQGKGTPVVFLHGFCEDKSLWTDFVLPLIDHCRVICMDLPNFGESPTMPNATMEKIAEVLVATLEHLQIEKCVLIGHSLGGYVGLAVAEHYPEKLMGFGMFHSTAFEDSPERKEGRDKAIASIEQNGVEPFVRALISSLFSPVQKQKEAIKSVIGLLIEKAKQLPPANIIATLQAMRDRKERIEIIRNVNFPLLFIIGKDDAPVPLEASMAQCYLPKQSMAIILENIGHMGMIEAVPQCQRVIKSFIDYCE
ncbi:MAG: alpha/beta hydrolase [Thermoflexibacter sp.]|jgi:pimeloyl-ACP methyl ester carboxylesterase|nr:alpha/beta hydrolase [Thermoflexibacter sp.]